VFQRFLSKEMGFYDLFDRHAQGTLEAAKIIDQALRDLSNIQDKVNRIVEIEHECDNIAHMTIDLMHRSFITPLDRYEIHDLITKMDDITDFIEAAARRLILFELKEVPPNLLRLADILIQSQEQVACMVNKLRKIKVDEVKNYCTLINELENQGDQLNRTGITELFHKYKDDPLMVIKLKEIYEILEAAIDRCEDIANIAEGITLEHM